MTHICVGKLTNIGSDNGLSPGRRQAIIWTNAGISLIGPLGTNFSEILIGIQTFSFKKMHLEMSSAKWRPFCLGLNELNHMSWDAHNTGITFGSGNPWQMHVFFYCVFIYIASLILITHFPNLCYMIDFNEMIQDSRFKIQNSFIASHQTYYDIQHRHISINYKYQYKYSNKLSWEQRELEILWDLWAPCLFHI